MATLESLSDDILIEVLLESQSIQDLQSLALSSRSIYNAFQQYRKLIILSKLKADLGADNYRQLLAILYMPQVIPGQKATPFGAHPCPSPRPGTADAPNLTTMLQPFLDHYFSGGSFDDPSDAASLGRISEIHKKVCRLTDLYFEHTTRRFLERKYPETKDTEVVPPLSPSERARIQRGFLRYELYCRLFPFQRSRRELSHERKQHQVTLFIRRLTPDQVEELFCIQFYFTSLAQGYLTDWEDQFIDGFTSSPGFIPPVDKRKQNLEGPGGGRPFIRATVRGQEQGKGMIACRPHIPWDRRVGYASAETRHCARDHLALLGLGFHLGLMDAGARGDDGKAQRDLVRSIDWGQDVVGGRDDFDPANSSNAALSPQHHTCPVVGDDEDEMEPPEIAECCRVPVVHRIRPREEDLGIVFWDAARIARCLKLGWHNAWGQNGGLFATHPYYELPDLTIGRRSSRRRVHQDLKGAQIPKGQLEELLDEFSWLTDEQQRTWRGRRRGQSPVPLT